MSTLWYDLSITILAEKPHQISSFQREALQLWLLRVQVRSLHHQRQWVVIPGDFESFKVCQNMICQFVCVRLAFSCKNLIDLRKHLDTHSSEPAYRCDFADCEYSTRSLYSIKNHYKRVHEVSQSENASYIHINILEANKKKTSICNYDVLSSFVLVLSYHRIK